MFDYLNWLTINKRDWKCLSDEEKAAFNPFQLNSLLSKSIEWVDKVNTIQNTTLTTEQVYNLYFDLLPAKRIYMKFPKKEKDIVPDELVKIVATYFQENYINSTEYCLEMSKSELFSVLKNSGVVKKDITKLLKWKN